ncbi:UNVERIFIED_CONTAM: hypothetical protein FKN15_058524 [Acipenser sinensis]
MNTRCPPKRVPSAARFFTHCELTLQPPQSYSVGGQRSSGQLTGKPAGARPDYRGRCCARLQLSEDVAGATFMAAGSSAPELFTSVIGGLPSGASSKGTLLGVQDTPYSLEIASSNPGYAIADRGREFPAVAWGILGSLRTSDPFAGRAPAGQPVCNSELRGLPTL